MEQTLTFNISVTPPLFFRDILSVPEAVWAATAFGQGKTVLHLIKAQQPEDRATILAASNAVRGLVINSHLAVDVAEMIRELPKEHQLTVLSADDAVWLLAVNGQGQTMVDLIQDHPHKSQQAIVNARNATLGLITFNPNALREIQAGWKKRHASLLSKLAGPSNTQHAMA